MRIDSPTCVRISIQDAKREPVVASIMPFGPGHETKQNRRLALTRWCGVHLSNPYSDPANLKLR
jgi:hypothetical protein